MDFRHNALLIPIPPFYPPHLNQKHCLFTKPPLKQEHTEHMIMGYVVTPQTDKMCIPPEPSHFFRQYSHDPNTQMATYDSIQTGNIHIDEGERKMKDLSPLAKDRLLYEPRYPNCYENPEKVSVRSVSLVLIP